MIICTNLQRATNFCNFLKLRGYCEQGTLNFSSLYRQYAPDVYRFALYSSGNSSVAEDLTSETFVRLCTARIAPLAASRLSTSAFAIAMFGGGLSPAEQELFDSSYELRKAGFAQREIEDALAFQRLKNEIIRSGEPWDEYTEARLVAKDQKWFRVPGTTFAVLKNAMIAAGPIGGASILRSGACLARSEVSAADDLWRTRHSGRCQSKCAGNS